MQAGLKSRPDMSVRIRRKCPYYKLGNVATQAVLRPFYCIGAGFNTQENQGFSTLRLKSKAVNGGEPEHQDAGV